MAIWVGDDAEAYPRYEPVHQGIEAAASVLEGVNFGCGSPTRAADRLVQLPPFAPAAERCARTAELSTMAKSGGSWLAASAASSPCRMPFSLQRLKRLNNRAWAVFGRNGAPTQTLATSMQNTADHPSVVDPRLTAQMGQQRLDYRSLHVAWPELVPP